MKLVNAHTHTHTPDDWSCQKKVKTVIILFLSNPNIDNKIIGYTKWHAQNIALHRGWPAFSYHDHVINNCDHLLWLWSSLCGMTVKLLATGFDKREYQLFIIHLYAAQTAEGEDVGPVEFWWTFWHICFVFLWSIDEVSSTADEVVNSGVEGRCSQMLEQREDWLVSRQSNRYWYLTERTQQVLSSTEESPSLIMIHC